MSRSVLTAKLMLAWQRRMQEAIVDGVSKQASLFLE